MQTKMFPPRFQNCDANGTPIIGSLEFYETGSSTKITTYSDYDRATANDNPMDADSNGRFGPVFFDPDDLTTGVKVVYYDAAGGAGGSGSPVYTDDRYDYSVISWSELTAAVTATNLGGVLWPQTSRESAASVTPTALYYPPGDVRRYGAVGDGVTEDTDALQEALDSNGHVWLQPGLTYITDTIYVKSDQIFDLNTATLKLKDSVTLAHSPVIFVNYLHKTGVQSGTGYEDFTPALSVIENVIIRNGTVDGNQSNNLTPDTTAPYSGFNGGMHGIWIQNYVKNIRLEKLKLTNTRTDGLEISGATSNNPDYLSDATATEIYVTDCDMDANYRQGCSIIQASGVHFTRCKFRNQLGTSPEAGCDIEPSAAGNEITDITFTDCDFTGNNQDGLILDIRFDVECMDVRVENCRFGDNGDDDLVFTGNNDTGASLKNIVVSNCVVTGQTEISANAGKEIVHDISFVNCKQGASDLTVAAVLMRDCASGSNVSFSNCSIRSARTNTDGCFDVADLNGTTVAVNGGEILNAGASSAVAVGLKTSDDSVFKFSGVDVNGANEGLRISGSKSQVYIDGSLIRNAATRGVLSTNSTAGKDPTVVVKGSIFRDCVKSGEVVGSESPQLQIRDCVFIDCGAEQTTLDGGEPSGETDMNVADISGISDGDPIGIRVDDGSIHWTTVSGAPAGTTVVLADALPDDAATGNSVYLTDSPEVTLPSTLNGRLASPEGEVTAPPGSTYLSSEGGANTTLYVKETGTGNTGWSAI